MKKSHEAAPIVFKRQLNSNYSAPTVQAYVAFYMCSSTFANYLEHEGSQPRKWRADEVGRLNRWTTGATGWEILISRCSDWLWLLVCKTVDFTGLCKNSGQELTLSENVKKRMSKISSASKIISKTMKNCKQKNRDESLKQERQFKWKFYSNESSSKHTHWLPLTLFLLNIYKIIYIGWGCQAVSINPGSLNHFLFIILLIVAGRGHASSSFSPAGRL